MKKFVNFTVNAYCEELSKKTPVPGGGSAAALTASLGAALISMVANYSLNKRPQKRINDRIKSIQKRSDAIRKRLLELVDLDAQAYMAVVNSRKASARQRKAALKGARKVPQEVCKRCYEAVSLTPYLVEKGNPYLISDISVAVELLFAAYKASLVNVEINQ